MPRSFHGHDVLNLIARRPAPWPLADFRAEVEAAFGEAPTFHTCHAQGMALDHLLVFLAQRGKIALTAHTIALGAVPACNHGQ